MLEFLVEIGLVLLIPLFVLLVIGIVPAPWWTYRGRNGLGPRLVQTQSTVGGEWPYRKCECGKDVDKNTNQHVELVSMTLAEVMEKYGPKCPDKENKHD